VSRRGKVVTLYVSHCSTECSGQKCTNAASQGGEEYETMPGLGDPPGYPNGNWVGANHVEHSPCRAYRATFSGAKKLAFT
jgi:hypothetical protein